MKDINIHDAARPGMISRDWYSTITIIGDVDLVTLLEKKLHKLENAIL